MSNLDYLPVEHRVLAEFILMIFLSLFAIHNQRQFGSNYHVLETIAKYDNPAVKGITGMREYEKSRWCLKRQAHLALTDFVRDVHARHVFLSYNNEGIMSKDLIIEILSQYGTVTFNEVPHRRFKADSERKQKANNTIEYLFHLRKNKNV